MSLAFHILLSFLLLVAFYEDWRYRAITWLVFPLLAIVTLLIFMDLSGNWKVLGSNLIFIGAVMISLIAYVSVKSRAITNIFVHHFGIGDLLFLVAVAPLFAADNFVLFFISGMMFSGLVHFFTGNRITAKTIPLAGYLAIYVLLLKACSAMTQADLFHHTITG
jgi:hypothetical protein